MIVAYIIVAVAIVAWVLLITRSQPGRACRHPRRVCRTVSIQRHGGYPWECPSCVNGTQVVRCDRCGATWTVGIRIAD